MERFEKKEIIEEFFDGSLEGVVEPDSYDESNGWFGGEDEYDFFRKKLPGRVYWNWYRSWITSDTLKTEVADSVWKVFEDFYEFIDGVRALPAEEAVKEYFIWNDCDNWLTHYQLYHSDFDLEMPESLTAEFFKDALAEDEDGVLRVTFAEWFEWVFDVDDAMVRCQNIPEFKDRFREILKTRRENIRSIKSLDGMVKYVDNVKRRSDNPDNVDIWLEKIGD